MNSVKLIIRDDDVSFFTKPKDLEKVYSAIPDFPISFAVVPFIVSAGEACPETMGNNSARKVSDNIELTRYLGEMYNNGKCDLILHGITHEYHFQNGNKISEMIWREKDEPQYLDEWIKKGKNELESAFQADINCFAAPHNDIGKYGVQAIYRNGLHFSGIIPISFSRDLTIRSLYNYIKRFWVRSINGFQYPGVLNYGTHLEVNACVAGKGVFLYKMYDYCKLINAPLAVNVHYWDIRDNPQKYREFFDFIFYAIKDGAIPSRMRDVLI